MTKTEPENKGHRVFISYSNEKSDKTGFDRQVADMICSALESENISCWIDHRDIMPGEKWVNAMFNAVEKSKVMVLVFSANANKSQWVEDEITYALDEKIRIIPFRIENVTPRGALRVLRVRTQWIDAQQPPLQDDLKRLVTAVRTFLEKDKEKEKEIATIDIEISGNNVVEEKEFENYLSITMDCYINENYEKAWENILKAEKIKNSDKVRHLKKKIKGKISKKNELKTLEVDKNQQGLQDADFGDGIIMVSIPPGKFEMGSNDYDDEKPPHEVYLDGYRIGKYEVTIKQYMQFVNETKSHYPQWLEEGNEYNINTGSKGYYKKFVSDENCPVVGVCWEDAGAYCDWLSNKTGLKFKLPTEAQWEKAARGTDCLKYPWGDREPDETLANFGGKIGKTTPVGSYPDGASPYDLLDMAGNVWEWCGDWYGSDYYKNAPKDNPQGPKSGTSRVLRGGSWYSLAGFLRCSYRNYVRPSVRYNYAGFRLCQDN